MPVSSVPACACGCTDPRGSAVHPVCRVLDTGDLDRAFALGLMDAVPCPGCSRDCVALLERVQDERRQALAARERHRQRDARLTRLREERKQRRAGATAPASSHAAGATPADQPAHAAQGTTSTPNPALPAAAAAALARAQAKAAARSDGKHGEGKP